MNDSQQETPADIQETEFGGPADVSKQKRVIYFSSGETMEEEDSEEEEEESQRKPPFTEPGERKRWSFKNMAFLVGRISLLACDVLGERLAGALGLNAAKYQYAIDQHQREHKTTSGQSADNKPVEGQSESLHLSPGGLDHSQYGATGDVRQCPTEPQKNMDTHAGWHNNRGYQADEEHLEEH